MTDQGLKEKYSMFTDSWKFYRKWAVQDFPMKDEQWEQVFEEAHGIMDKYGGTMMIKNLVCGAVSGLEEYERQVRE